MGATASPLYPPFSISVVRDGNEAAVILSGELDLAGTDAVERQVRDLQSRFEHVVIDLQGLEFMDSSGLRALLVLREAASRGGQTLEVIPGPPAVQRIFELTQTAPLFNWRVRPDRWAPAGAHAQSAAPHDALFAVDGTIPDWHLGRRPADS